MEVLIYQFVGQVLFACFWISGSSKLAARPRVNQGAKTRIDRMTDSVAFNALQLIVALIMIAPVDALVRVIADVIGAATVAAGLILHFATPARSCRCFGDYTPKNPKVMLAIQFLMMIGLVMHLLLGGKGRLDGSVYSWLPGVLSVLLTPLFVSPTRVPGGGQLPAQSPSAGGSKPKAVDNLEPGLRIGLDVAGGTVTLADLAKTDQPLFIVGLHSHCDGCRTLVPDYCAFAKAFGHEFPIVAVADNREFVPDTPGLVKVVDESGTFQNAIGADAAPWAVLVNGADLRRAAAPLAVGPNRVRMLFAATLNARVPSPV